MTESEIRSSEYWAEKGDVRLFVFRKTLASASDALRPVLFLVHGSSLSARTGFDLEVPGRPGYFR